MGRTRFYSPSSFDEVPASDTGHDLKSYRAVTFSASAAAITAAVAPGIKLQDSPDGTTWTDVAATYQNGTFDKTLAGTSAKNQFVDYVPQQRYVRVQPSTGVTVLLIGPRHFDPEPQFPIVTPGY